LRQQLEVYARLQRRPRLSPLDRAFWVALVPSMAAMEAGAGDRKARHRGPLASRTISPLLAVDRAGTGTTADLRGDEESHRANGSREWMARAEDPGRAIEDRDRREPRHDLALLAEDQTRSRVSAALDDVPS